MLEEDIRHQQPTTKNSSSASITNNNSGGKIKSKVDNSRSSLSIEDQDQKKRMPDRVMDADILQSDASLNYFSNQSSRNQLASRGTSAHKNSKRSNKDNHQSSRSSIGDEDYSVEFSKDYLIHQHQVGDRDEEDEEEHYEDDFIAH